MQLFPFFIVLLAGLFFSALFKKLHLPLVISLIIAGVIIGPHGLEMLSPDATLEFLGRIGLVFLMFLAGLEVRISSFRKLKTETFTLTLLNGGIPLLAGIVLGFALGLGIWTSLLIGIIFISSSVAVIIPSLEGISSLKKRFGKTIVGSAILQDTLSLFLLLILLHIVSPTLEIPLALFLILIGVLLLFLKWFIPRLRWFMISKNADEGDLFQQELRLIITVLIGTVVLFEIFGLHDIVAGFFTGLILSESIRNEAFKVKFRAIGYGFFIPIFFILVGLKTDLSVFKDTSGILILITAVVATSVSSKFISGFIGGKILGFSNTESKIVGVSTISQLFTTLAVVFAGAELGLLSPDLVTSLIILSILTTFAAPMLINFFGKKLPVVEVVGIKEEKIYDEKDLDYSPTNQSDLQEK